MQVITRDEATEKGLKRYFTGVACIRGHLSERYTSTGGCVDCLLRKLPRNKPDPNRFKYLPSKALYFGNAEKLPTQTEAEAVFRWMEAAGWHLAALKILQADPALMARFDHEWSTEDKFATGRGSPDPTPTKKS